MQFSLPVGKGRKPKFELHLHIYDLNNVPLVSGSSFIKWHLSHSIHAEHRGRTPKCPISNHRVDYSFSKIIPSIRISIDKNNSLAECPIEFEVLQEFPHAEKITLGHVRLNLSEYVEECEALAKDSTVHTRLRRTSTGGHSTTGPLDDAHVEEGVIRRHLMQDSKVNSTLKIGILIVQVDGDRGFVAPPLRTAPVFGGIAGLIPPEEDETGQAMPNTIKSRDNAEYHDLYRRTLAASWYAQPGELPADECIEDIFSGGNGWRTKDQSTSSSAEDDYFDDQEPPRDGHSTLRPVDLRRLSTRHFRSAPKTRGSRADSAASDKSGSTVVGLSGGSSSLAGFHQHHHHHHHDHHHNHQHHSHRRTHSRNTSRDEMIQGRNRSTSLASLAATLDNEEMVRDTGLKNVKGAHEYQLRDDMIAWRLPGTQTA